MYVTISTAGAEQFRDLGKVWVTITGNVWAVEKIVLDVDL